MRRIYPAYPDLLSVTHAVRPGYLPADDVVMDPIRMAIVWKDAPRRTLPRSAMVPRSPVRAVAFSRVLSRRMEVLDRLMSRGSALLLVLDELSVGPEELHLSPEDRVCPLLPILPRPLGNGFQIPENWSHFKWGAILGIFPFPGAEEELDVTVGRLHKAGATFILTVPLLLTPQDRHRILEIHGGASAPEHLENALFHSDISRGFRKLEQRAGILMADAEIEDHLSNLVPKGCDPGAIRTAALLRLWARRLDQSRQESSWGWKLRRAAAAVEPLRNDPRVLARENNLRVVPGFDEWVEEFTRALWDGGQAVDDAWRRWSSEA